jgi:hypothetical protein
VLALRTRLAPRSAPLFTAKALHSRCRHAAHVVVVQLTNEQALQEEVSRLRRHCAALQTRVSDLEAAPPSSRKRRQADGADGDAALDAAFYDDALLAPPPTPRLAAWLAHVQAHARSAPHGERLAIAVAALQADVAARSAALQEVVWPACAS